MVDDISSQSPEGAPGGPKPKSPSFLGSPTGRLVLGGVALFVVVVAVGAYAFFFLLNTGSQTTTTNTKPKSTSQVTTVTAPPVNPPEAPLKDSFTFRNVFIPTVHPASPEDESTETSATSSETSSTGTGSANTDTLVLESIVTDSGERVATFTWKGTTYETREGDQVGSSPWQVLEIYSDSVLMLYGDSRVTLSVGQGYSTTSESVSK